MSKSDLARLIEADKVIQDIVTELGLDVMPQEFDVVPAQKMLEIMAYKLPVNFSHWSFGRDYEIERTKFEYGFAVPYEVVFNSNPCRAYLMETNPFPIQVMVMAHVYAHNDFIRNNRHFQLTRRDMITSASEATARFRQYEEDYGLETVEKLIDSGMAIQWNINPDEQVHPETEEQVRERLYGWAKGAPARGAFDDLLPPKEISIEEKRKLRKKTPPESTADLLGYIIEHSPKGLQEWQKDILSTIRNQAQYFMPYRRTKIMNEGWATYWHEKILQQLFADRFLSAEEHGYCNLYNARVKAHHPRQINPYLLGWAQFNNIEERWDRGCFGEAYEECNDAGEKTKWDLGLMKGREKIFQIRRTHMDWFFIDEFLNKEVIDDLNLYIYEEKDKYTHYDLVVTDTVWIRVKQALLQSLMNWGIPRILVTDGNYQGSLQLYLKHEFEGLPLDDEYCRKTLEHIFFLWERPVYLETHELDANKTRGKLYIIDEKGIHIHSEQVG
jgi:stage V sporulation protein R